VPRKSRTPPPPKRPVQAPRVRTDARDPERRRRAIVYAVGASGFLMLAVVIGILVLAGRGNGDDGGSGGAVATLRAAGCTYRHPKSQGRNHVPALAPGFEYNSDPPSSGPHSNQTIFYNAYDDPVPAVNYVHNLEHGAVVIQYGDEIPDGVVSEIFEFYREDPNGLIMAPLPALGDEVALVSWTHVARCDGFDREAFETFIDEFGFKGPESCKTALEQGCFRREDMQPNNP
jgi:hypothetical protein